MWGGPLACLGRSLIQHVIPFLKNYVTSGLVFPLSPAAGDFEVTTCATWA
jgi:hypothetical protein